MAISFQVLGLPGRDNALFVKLDTGQQLLRFLFDCGDGCPHSLAFQDVLGVDELCFSHLHMDHIGGFDAFFRANHNRGNKPNSIWGPAGSAEILQHRFRGFLWNLVEESEPVSWFVHEVHPGEVRSFRFDLRDAFRTAHEAGSRPRGGPILHGNGFTLDAHLMDHGSPSVAYVLRESSRVNVDTTRLASLGLGPGPWLKQVRGPTAGPGETVTIQGKPYALAELQKELLSTTAGDSIAYLTDFRMDLPAREYLAGQLEGVTTVICECQYTVADRELAERNKHMAADEGATLAATAGIGRLVLFHLSDRYQPEGWRELLAEARAVFPNTSFPEGWSMETLRGQG